MINFFGEQRFSTNNKDIGYAIIRKDFKNACEIIAGQSGESAKMVKSHLASHPSDFVGALKSIQPKILLLYMHAYQSFLWNAMAAEEIQKKKPSTKIPLIGFGTEETPEIKDILKQEHITTRDFIIRQIPHLTVEGGTREIYAEIKNLMLNTLEKGYQLSFELPKGSYATEAIGQMFT